MENDIQREKLILFLEEIGVNHTGHTGRSLMDHLMGTYDLLKKWGCDDSTAIAGGLHSVYGTNIFTKESINDAARPIVRRRFGNRPERLAWLFGSINRPKAIELGFGIDRRNNIEVKLNKKDLKALQLMEAANLMEQGSSLRKWPNIAQAVSLHVQL